PQEVVKIDFGPTEQIVEQGYSAFTSVPSPAGSSATESFASSYATPGEDLEVTVGGTNWGFRDRGDDIAGPIGRVQDDFVFAEGGLSLTFENLIAGNYHLVIYSHDRDFDQAGFEIRLDNQRLGQLTPETSA